MFIFIGSYKIEKFWLVQIQEVLNQLSNYLIKFKSQQ